MKKSKKNIYVVLVISLVLIESAFIYLSYKSFNNNKTYVDEVNLLEDLSADKNNMFAIMLGDKNGIYKESQSNKWPTDGSYSYNSSRSGCIDANGNELTGVLSFNAATWTATLTTNTTAYCYLYFDIDQVAPQTFTFYLGGSTNPTYVTNASTTAYLKWTDTDIASYCLSTSNSSSGCTWNSTSGQTLTGNYTLASGDGTKTVYAFLKDAAGNISSSVTDTIILDTTKPVVNSVTKTSDKTDSISISVSASDATSGVKTYYYQIGTNSVVSSTSNTYTFTGLTKGTKYTIKVYVVDNAGLQSETKSYTYETKSTTPLYEQLINTVSSSVLWNSTLEDDGYRFVGTNPANYICFGTSDKSTCTGDTDKYMYRIIGIFEDESGKQHLKLIKKEALNTAYAWHSDKTTDTAWNESDLYKRLNGSYFLSNTTYMPSTTWTNKISTWNYTMTNTLTYSNYTSNGTYGLYYYYNTGKVMYLHELNRSSKTSQTCYYSASTTAGCSVGTWTNLSTKISLMYASDYALSLGSAALNYTCNSNYSTMKTGWLHLSNNDSSASNSHEWTMSRYGADSNGYCGAWSVNSIGSVLNYIVYSTYAVRPVFYLESETEYLSGSGTTSDPYMIIS